MALTQTSKMTGHQSGKKRENPKMKLFAQRVTVAGLEEAYGGKYRHERISFRITLFLASAAIIYCSFNVIVAYLNPGTVFDTTDITGIQAPFPIVSLCGPEAIKRTVMRQLATKEPFAGSVQALLLKYTMTLEEFIELVVSVSALSVQMRMVMSPVQRAAMEFANDISSSVPNGFIGFLLMAHPKCDEMFSMCSFETRPFNCCLAVEQMPLEHSVCYQMDLTRVPELANLTAVTGGLSSDPSRLTSSGLVMHVRIDWPDVVFEDDVASDGFNVFIGRVASPWTLPTALPSGMDAIVTLAQPILLKEMSNCQPNTLAQSTHTGLHGDACLVKELATRFKESFGCSLPSALSDLDGNNLTWCTPRQLFILVGILDGSAFKVEAFKTFYGDKETILRDTGKRAFSKCRPLCTRFIYEIFSASYSSFHRIDQAGWERGRENQSWSRIRIFFPSASYRLHKEDPTSPAYMGACEVGGVMGVYLGLSMVTVVQILVYSLLIFWHCKKTRLTRLDSSGVAVLEVG